QSPEREWDDGVDRGGHVASTCMGRAHPVAEAACLGAAAANICQRQSAQQNVVVLAEHEERISKVPALVFGIALDATPKGRAGEIVGRPGRLPGSEEIAACLA